MADYFALMLISVAVAFGGDRLTLGSEYRKKHRRLIICSLVIFILLAGFAGLRTRCNDTGAYKHAYELIVPEQGYDDIDWDIGSNPLFNVVNIWLKTGGTSTQNFLMFWALVTVGCYIIFVHKYSSNYAITLFLLFTTGCYGFVFAGIKQAAAVGIALIGVMYALKKKWVPYVACIAIATLIHPYSLMYLIVPFMQFEPCGKKTILLLIVAILGGLFLRPLLGTVVSITSMIGEKYTVTEFSDSGVNIFRVLVCNVPTILAFMYRKQLFADSTNEENLMVNLAMINGAIMFIGLFGTANYFARLANYFLIFQAISLPWMLKKIGGKNRQILTVLMIIGYLVYFYYENMIAIPFDHDFARISVAEYFAQMGR